VGLERLALSPQFSVDSAGIGDDLWKRRQEVWGQPG
jgi:hypothetical protein